MANTTNSQNDPQAEHQLAEIKMTSAPQLTFDSKFKVVLATIPSIVNQAQQYLKADIASLNEDDIAKLQDQMKHVQSFNKEITEARRNMRRYFDTMRDQFTTVFDEQLSNAQYDKLANVEKQTKQLKSDILAYRVNHRWADLKPTFEANITAYPIIAQYAQALGDFSAFRIHHPKLVTGAKSGHITDKQRTVINNEIAQWANAITQIRDNAMHLNTRYQNALLQDFIASPTTFVADGSSAFIARIQYYQSRQQADAQAEAMAKQQAAEMRRRQAMAQQQAAAGANSAKPQPTPVAQPAPAPYTPPKVAVTESYDWLINMLFSNPRTKNIHGNDHVKTDVLFDLFSQINNPQSIFAQKTKQDPKAIIRLVRYIINL